MFMYSNRLQPALQNLL